MSDCRCYRRCVCKNSSLADLPFVDSVRLLNELGLDAVKVLEENGYFGLLSVS